jgi:hypothetical protein
MKCLAISVLLLQVAVALASDDAECLLQVDMQVDQKRDEDTQSPCACVPWTQAYAEGASCSTGNELFFVKQRVPTSQEASLIRHFVGRDICDNFFYHLTGNMCVNRQSIYPDNGQWCYVSSQCNNLNNGVKGQPGHFNMKLCTSQDASLRDLSPRQLAQKSIEDHLDLSMLDKMSYPVNKHHWEDVRAFWGVQGTPDDLSPELRQEMSDIVATGRPHSFDNNISPHPPHYIVVGMTAFAVGPNTASGLFEEVQTEATLHKYWMHAAAQTDNPATLTKLQCLTGCDLPTAQ